MTVSGVKLWPEERRFPNSMLKMAGNGGGGSSSGSGRQMSIAASD
jgi:hypothetical protein